MVIRAVDGLPETDWDIPGSCGDWSVKDIVAHLTSCEQVVLDVLTTFQEGEPTPYVLYWINQPGAFNASLRRRPGFLLCIGEQVSAGSGRGAFRDGHRHIDGTTAEGLMAVKSVSGSQHFSPAESPLRGQHSAGQG